MTRPERRKSTSARISLVVDRLEERQLLSVAAASPRSLAAEVRIDRLEVAKEARAVKLEQAKALREFKVTRPTTSPLVDLVQLSPRSKLSNGGGAQYASSPYGGTYGPTQLQTAYGVNLLGLSNEGQGVTIAIVDEFDDADITKDTNAYSAQYGLPKMDGLSGDPTLTVYKDQALGTVTSAAGTGVGVETSLDVEMAHAMAPQGQYPARRGPRHRQRGQRVRRAPSRRPVRRRPARRGRRVHQLRLSRGEHRQRERGLAQ